MKRITIFAGVGVMMCVAIGALTFPALAQQANLPPERLEIIRSNCTTAQSAIQRVQKSDIVTRTNKGRSYEYILQLMASLNSRIAINKLSQPEMSDITTQLQDRFNEFYGHYTEYEVSVGNVLAIKCADRPEDFYQTLELVRTNRSLLAKDVEAMQGLIDRYRDQVAQLQESVSEEVGDEE